MIFNNLLNLIYCEKAIDNNICNDIISDNKVDKHFNKLEVTIIILLCKYFKNLKNICDNHSIITYQYGLSEYKIYFGNYTESFSILNKIYKYIICILFLDDNSEIVFFNNCIKYPKTGELLLFPSSWFFIFKIRPKNNNKNTFVINNIISSL